MPDMHIGTSAFTAAGWEGSFYPKGVKPADYLSYYATKFDTVELNNTFYRTCDWRIVISPGHMACNIVTSFSLCY
jgi:uncharacterized protein YecE (DUF72 family)